MLGGRRIPGVGNMHRFVLLSIIALASVCNADVIFVDASAGGAGDGSSWADAYVEFQDALDDPNIAYGWEIWVAAGTYKPDPNGLADPREATFQMVNGVGIYGGFPTGGNMFANRDPNQYETILSGDLSGNDNPATPVEDLRYDPNRIDNCYHVFYHPDSLALEPNAILDGFTVTGGHAATGYDEHSYGGGMYNSYSSPTVSNCTFTANYSSHGGGMHNLDSSSPTVSNCIFTTNGSRDGGGMYNKNYSSPTVTGCTFTGNFGWGGGGMLNYYLSSPTVSECIFAGNSTEAYGGGMYNRESSSPTVIGCIFTGNSAAVGGGMENYKSSSPTVISCIFTGNSADSSGGGMDNGDSSNPKVISCTFTGNSAGMSGGGMSNTQCSSTVSNCTFTGNSAGEKGGGMRNYESNPTVTGCTFSGNSAGYGGGMNNNINVRISPIVTGCTFTGNRANDGGGMYNFGNSDPTVINCILWGNTASSNGNEIYNSSYYATSTISYSDIAGSLLGGTWDASLGTDGGGNIDTDPLFVDADGLDGIAGTEDDNLRLLAGSPCIDVGDNTAVPADTADLDDDGDTAEAAPFDLDGNARIMNGTVDMGAYENHPIHLLNPDGIEVMMAGTVYDITWQAVDNIENVSLEYSDADGLAWAVIDPNTPNDGEYNWTVPDVTSEKCLVRVSDAIDPNVFDVSDDVFTIYVCQFDSPADLNNDCKADMPDLGIMSVGWSGVYDFNDLTILADDWLRNGNPFDSDFTEVYEGMVFIPSGEFLMGDHFSEGYIEELPVHAVYLDSFYMSRYEVTNRQYCDYLNSAYPAQIKVVSGRVYASTDTGNLYPYCDTSTTSTYSQIDFSAPDFSVRTKPEIGGRDMSNDPMVEVSWYGAVAYCDYYGYRLPTEAGWEYAARGGEHSPYYRHPWGDSIDGSKANYWSSGDPYETGGRPFTTPVGYYDGSQIPAGSDMANGYGLYDMTGNVWEWCSDWYDGNYYNVSPYDNPQGPASGLGRVIRGGGWYLKAYDCRVADRYYYYPDDRYAVRGFRIVLDF